MHIPVKSPPLAAGDRVALIAPAGAVAPERIAPAAAAVERMGYQAVLANGVAGHRRYLAGDDDARAADVNAAFACADIHGIIALRGGYGSVRILELLDYERIAATPKFFAGYSDITTLHTVLNQRCGLITFHAPMAAVELCQGMDAYTSASLAACMAGRFRGAARNPDGQAIRALCGGRCAGRLIGGNLTSVVSMLGTPYEIDTAGKILLLEDVNEPPYRIDRLLTQLRLAGKLAVAAGIVLGSFTDCGDACELTEIWRETLPAGKPAVCGLAAGHCAPAMSLALGAWYELDADQGELLCME